MVNWLQRTNRRRSRADLSRRSVHRALRVASDRASASGTSMDAVSTVGNPDDDAALVAPLSVSGKHQHQHQHQSKSKSMPMPMPKPESQQRERIIIDRFTEDSLRLVASDVLPCSLFVLASALADDRQVVAFHRAAHSDRNHDNGNDENCDLQRDTNDDLSSSSVLVSLSRVSLSSSSVAEETSDERSERRTAELRAALAELRTSVGSTRAQVGSWDEARAALSTVLKFPSDSDQKDKIRDTENETESEGGGTSIGVAFSASAEERPQKKREGGSRSYGSIAALLNSRDSKRSQKVAKKTRSSVLTRSFGPMAKAGRHRHLGFRKYADMLQRNNLLQMQALRQLTSSRIPPPLASIAMSVDSAITGRDRTKSLMVSTASAAAAAAANPSSSDLLSLGLSGADRVDVRIDHRYEEAERAARAKDREEAERQDAAIAAREAREEAEEAAEQAAAEAASRASSLLRELTEEEEQIVREAIYGIGPETDILATSDTDSVQRKSMHLLQPGTWLNDEVIHYFLLMLARRDAYLSEQDPSRKRCHFFKSFFVTKLLDDEGYKYSNVKRWSKKVPGKDIFQLDKIFCPVNVGGMHWTVAVIYVQEKRIVYYDSMSGEGERICKGLLRYLQDEHQAKKGQPLPDAEEWELVSYPDNVPQQRNGFDCGVFTCMFCDFLSTNCPLSFNQEHITQCRERIALSIMRGVAIE